MGSYKVYIFLVGYAVFATFLFAQIDQYNMSTDIGSTELEDVTILGYLSIFWEILSFQMESGTEEIPDWINLLVIIPIYAVILYFIGDVISPTISD